MAIFDRLKRTLGGAVAQGARRVAHRLEHRPAAVFPAAVPAGGQAVVRPAKGSAKVPDGPRAMFGDPLGVMQAFGYKDRPSAISYETMRDLLYRLPIVSNIIQVRVEQVASFGHVATDRYALGFRVKLREARDTPTDAESALCRKVEQFLLYTGRHMEGPSRDTFETYLRKITRDALLFDQNCTEIVPGNDGRPSEFYAIDAANIRLASNLRPYVQEKLADDVAYVEIYNEAIRSRWNESDIIFGVRNPSTDIRLNGYGTSELEYLMTTITALLHALDYNAKMFTQGTMARGILNIRDEDLTNEQLNSISMQWNNMLKGVENAWKTPVIAAKNGVDWINLQGLTEMSARDYIDYLVKLTTAAYKIAPEELNLSYGAIGQTSSLTQPNNRDKIVDSKERGLRPLLRHIQGNLNQKIIWPLCPELELEFCGLDAMTREQQLEFNSKRVRTYLTLNEVRAEEDLKPLEGGDIVLDGAYLQARAQSQQGGQQPFFGGPPQDFGSQGTPQEDTGANSGQTPPATDAGAMDIISGPAAPADPSLPQGAREVLSLGKAAPPAHPHRLNLTL